MRTRVPEERARENALFFAPSFRAGMLLANSGPVGVPPTAHAPRELFRHVMPFWSAGARFGHFTLAGKRATVAPELIIFLDITYW